MDYNTNNNNTNGIDDGMDMFDIMTGKVISWDHNKPIKYEPSVRWDDNNVILEDVEIKQQPQQQQQQQQLNLNIQTIKLDLNGNTVNNTIQSTNPTVINTNNAKTTNTTTFTTTTTTIATSTTPVSNGKPTSGAATTTQLVECKDMEPLLKVEQLQPYVIEKFEVGCNRFYRAIIDSDFWAKVSLEMGFYDMKEGEWKVSPSGCHQQRELNFKTPISFKIGPKVATVKQIQKIRRTPTGGYFMETNSYSTDVPYGESFSVENYISLEPCKIVSPTTIATECLLKVSTAVKFIKSIWGISGLIEKSVVQSNKDFFNVWTKMAKKLILEQQLEQSIILDNNNNLNISNQIQQQQQSPPTQLNQQPNINHIPIPSNNINTLNQQQQQTNQQLDIKNYQDLKQLFIQLFRDTQNPKTVKLISHKTNQHVANITIHNHYTVGHVLLNLIPQTLPDLALNQLFQVYWYDKRNDLGLFFSKDLDLPILNYLQSSDSLCISTLQPQQDSNILKQQMHFQIVQQPNRKAIIKLPPPSTKSFY